MASEKDKWVDEALNSLDGIKPAIPPVSMHHKIMQRMDTGKFRIVPDTVSMPTVYRMAAAIALIISINAYSCIAFSKNQAEKKAVQAFAKEYSLSSSGESLLNI